MNITTRINHWHKTRLLSTSKSNLEHKAECSSNSPPTHSQVFTLSGTWYSRWHLTKFAKAVQITITGWVKKGTCIYHWFGSLEDQDEASTNRSLLGGCLLSALQVAFFLLFSFIAREREVQWEKASFSLWVHGFHSEDSSNYIPKYHRNGTKVRVISNDFFTLLK